MAPLIVRQAADARLAAQELRAESVALRATMRANLDTAHTRSRRAAGLAEAGRLLRVALPAPSPWSGLVWRRDDEALHSTLVPVP